MAQDKTILLKVELDTSALKDSAKQAEEALARLKPEMEKLRKESGTGTVEYAKLKEEVKQYTKQLNDSASALVINEQLQGKTSLTTIEQSKAQKALAVAYNNLTDEQRENTEEGKRITAAYNAVNKTLNENALAVGDGRRNVGLYAESIKKAYAEIGTLKTEVQKIGFVYGENKKALDDNKKSLDALTASGITSGTEYDKLTAEVAYYTEAVQTNEQILQEANAELKEQETQLAAVEKEARKVGFVYGENAEKTQSLKTQLRLLKEEVANFEPGTPQFIEATARAAELEDKLKDVRENISAQAAGSGFEKLSNTFGLLKEDLSNLDFEGVSEKAKTFSSIAGGLTLKEMIGGLKNAGSALISLGKTILLNPIFALVAVVAAVAYAISELTAAEETLSEKMEKTNALFETRKFVLDQIEGLLSRQANAQLRMAELTGKSEAEIYEIKRKSLADEEKLAAQRIALTEKNYKETAAIAAKAAREGDTEALEASTARLVEIQKDLFAQRLEYRKYYDERRLLDFEYIEDFKKRSADAAKEAADKAAEANRKAIEDAREARKRIRDAMTEADKLDADQRQAALDAELQFTQRAIELAVENEQEKAEQLLVAEQDYLDAYKEILDEANEAQKDALENAAADEIANLKGTKAQIATQRRLIEERVAAEIDEIDRTAKRDLAAREQDLAQRRIDAAKAVNAERLKLNQKATEAASNELEEQRLALEVAGAKELDIIRELYDEELALAKAKNKAIQEDDQATAEAKKAAELEYQRTVFELGNKQKDANKEQQAQQLEQVQSTATLLGDTATQLVGFYSDINQQATDAALANLEMYYNSQISGLDAALQAQQISLEKYNQEKEKADNEYNQKVRQEQKRAAQKDKDAALIQAAINTAVGVTAALPNFILAAITAALGVAQVAIIASKPVPEFAKGGKVLSGQKIGAGDGKAIHRPNGDNLLATVRTGEVILNEAQQAALGGAATFARIGVPGFATGGLVPSDTLATTAASDSIAIENANAKNLRDYISLMPPPRVIVQDIIEGVDNVVSVQTDADI